MTMVHYPLQMLLCYNHGYLAELELFLTGRRQIYAKIIVWMYLIW